MTQPPSQAPDPNAAGGGQPQPDASGPPHSPEPGYTPPSQYPPPPGGGYPPPGDYPPPGYPQQPAAPPPGYLSSEEKTYALVAHFGGAVGALVSFGLFGFVGPLVALLAKGNDSPTVKAHAKAALNFFIPAAGAALLLFILRICNGLIVPGILATLVSALLYLVQTAVWAVAVIFGIIGGVKANEGALYRYPISLPIIK
jgi:uncharacterized Tic20 family protein